MHLNRICVFCGSSSGNRPEYTEAAARLGGMLAQQGTGLVYGGACVGLMGTLADSCMAAGGQVIGVMPEALVVKEIAHRGLTELRIVSTMHQRKALMAELSDAFIALPGGFGTLEEFCEVLTWSQLGIQRKPCGLLNVAGYYDLLLALFDHAVDEGLLKAGNRAMVLSDTDPAGLLEQFRGYAIPWVDKWMLDRT